jgi:hypothetical protein
VQLLNALAQPLVQRHIVLLTAGASAARLKAARTQQLGSPPSALHMVMEGDAMLTPAFGMKIPPLNVVCRMEAVAG